MKWRIPITAVLAALAAGCCDQQAVQACEAEKAAQTARALAHGVVANGPDEKLELSVAAVDGVDIKASVAHAACVDGRGSGGSVQVTWSVKKPGVNAVRILVGSGDEADKTWVEAGASGSEVTGTWINDGSLLRVESLAARETLGLIRVKARACP